MATFPGGIFSPRTRENKDGVVYDSAKAKIGYAEDHDLSDDEVVAVETALGINPKGSDTDVKTRIARNETRGLVFIIDGGGAEIATGEHGHLRIPFKCEIVKATLLADQTGSIVIDIWKDTYANFPPTVADTITAAAKPTIAAGVKDEDGTLTGWTKAIALNDILAFNVDSVTDIERVMILLEVETKA